MRLRKFILVSVLIFTASLVVACKDNIKYGSIDGKATGSIDFSKEVPEVEIDNIIADMGTEIDYTSEIEVISADGLKQYQVGVNTSGVNTEEPGTYTATYTITYDDKTYTKQVKVTIEDNTEKSTTIAQQTTVQQTATQATTSAVVTTAAGNINQTTAATTITPTTQTPGVPLAKIELLSGEVISIKCTNSKYIVSTRTDESTVTRSGIKYSVEKLIITFNTGTEQVLETIEKKIS